MFESGVFLIAGIAAAAAGTGSAHMPIRLDVEVVNGAQIVRVIAHSPVACAASYTLSVGQAGGGNRSVNRGTATIAPGSARTLATVSVKHGSTGAIPASLRVEPYEGGAYELTWPATVITPSH